MTTVLPRAAQHPSVIALWRQYLATLGRRPEDARPTYSFWHFGDNPRDADELLDLVMRGVKRATAASVYYFESRGRPLPAPGDLHVVTTWEGEGRCVIRTTEVEVTPYRAVGAAHAAAEGEGDLSLEYWRRVHWDYYARELEGSGVTLNEHWPVVCERFELVYPPVGR